MINSQRSTAIKFEINHDIMWRAYYEVRLETNRKNRQKVLPDERMALDALINNDKDRIKFYANAASDNWDSLNELLKKEKVVDTNLEKLIKGSVMKVNMIKLDSEKTIREIQDQISKLQRLNIPIKAQITADENLDMVRKNQEEVTDRRIKHDLSFERLFDDNGKVGDRVTGRGNGVVAGTGGRRPAIFVAKNGVVRQSGPRKTKSMIADPNEMELLRKQEGKREALENMKVGHGSVAGRNKNTGALAKGGRK